MYITSIIISFRAPLSTMDKKLALIFLLTAFDQFLPTFANQSCVGSGISEDTLTITNGKRRVRGKSVDNIEQVQVKWEPNIEQNKAKFDEYDLTRLQLYMLKQGGGWEKFKPKKQVKYHGHYKWTVPRIPCLKYDYKILVPSKNEEDKFLCTTPKSKPPETKETIRSAKFKPGPPTDMIMNVESNHASFRWNRSQCAEEYELYVEDSDPDNSKHKVEKQLDGVNGATAEFDNLKSCTSYEVYVYAKVEGGEDGDDFLKESFQTKPEINSASHLDLTDATSTSSEATLRFFTYMDQVNCLKNFTIETCKKTDCSHTKKLVIAENHEELKYASNGLEHCTNYLLKVQPSYPEVYIKPRNVNITTKFDETKKIVPSIEPTAHDVKITMRNIDCVESYVINYGIVGSYDLEEMSGLMDMEVITIVDLLPSTTYQISMTGTLKTGDVTLFEAQKFKTLEEQTTTQAKKETHTPTEGLSSEVKWGDVNTSAEPEPGKNNDISKNYL